MAAHQSLRHDHAAHMLYASDGGGEGGEMAASTSMNNMMTSHHHHQQHQQQQQQQQHQGFSMDMDLSMDGYSDLNSQYERQFPPISSTGQDMFARLPSYTEHQPGQSMAHLHPVVPSQHTQLAASSHQHQHQDESTQYGLLAPAVVPSMRITATKPAGAKPSKAQGRQRRQQRRNEVPSERTEVTETFVQTNNLGDKSHGMPVGKLVVDPPDLDAWRDRLFHVDGEIVLTNEQFETYFPHVDNVYSHRSTQRYKRKPFVSHYWDCRMKGRPPGTPKSTDPAKQKRKRAARERDLCDVKIKITEFFPEAAAEMGRDGGGDDSPDVNGVQEKFWTIQRVNGNGGNGKGDGVAGPHKHTLARSDEIKKSSVQRWVASQEKKEKKTQSQKPVLERTTGSALETARRHANDEELKLFASAICPFSQQIWIALEAKGLPYQYCEVDVPEEPLSTALHQSDSRSKVHIPTLKHGHWTCTESSIILEYLEDLATDGATLMPTDPKLRAKSRLWIDHINRRIVPAIFILLGKQKYNYHPRLLEQLQTELASLVNAADKQGPFFLGRDLSLLDVHFAPFAARLVGVMRVLYMWQEKSLGPRWRVWVEALEADACVKATMSDVDLYLESTDALYRLGNPIVASDE